METTSIFSKITNSTSFKLAVILLLSLLLLIPTVFIRNLIDERQNRRDSTIEEITSKWGEEQSVMGPVLVIPYERYEKTSKNTFISKSYYFHLLPDELQIHGDMIPEVRYRGIYKVITYRSTLSISGTFSAGSFTSWPDQADKILWKDVHLVLGISDLTGLDQIRNFDWNGRQLEMEGGIPIKSSIEQGISTQMETDPAKDQNFLMEISLHGSESLFFVPAGKNTTVTLSSSWPDPSFDGSQLPDDRTVNEKGFKATWNAIHLTRSFPQKWTDSAFGSDIAQSAFGVRLLIPVDGYQKTTRSVKYAFLFIGLTFLVIFIMEIMSRIRIHPIQYLLTGIALVIFYSLLLSLSEHLPFTIAYLIASSGIVILIFTYSLSMFKQRKNAIITLTVLTALYGFLYMILNVSDFALLMGNIGLFIILAIIMFVSRKIDWYNGNLSKDSGEKANITTE